MKHAQKLKLSLRDRFVGTLSQYFCIPQHDTCLQKFPCFEYDFGIVIHVKTSYFGKRLVLM